MLLKELDGEFCVCKVKDLKYVDLTEEFCFVGKTDEEISVVTRSAPKDCIECENGWRGFRIEGTLDFSLIGILSKISAVLAENKIGIFVVSTYNTDYVFVKSENFKKAVKVLEDAGYEFASA